MVMHSFGGRPFGRPRFEKSRRPEYGFQIDLKDIKEFNLLGCSDV
jgi:hypothetical protein